MKAFPASILSAMILCQTADAAVKKARKHMMPVETVARIILREVGGEGRLDKVLTADSIWNRANARFDKLHPRSAEYWQSDVVKVCVQERNDSTAKKRRYRYSCLDDMAAFEAAIKPSEKRVYAECVALAERILARSYQPSSRCTLYFNPSLVKGGWPSGWDRSKTRFIAQTETQIYLEEIRS